MKNIVIIGAGSIGALKNPREIDDPNDDKNILTWAHAVRFIENKKNNFLVLSAIVDCDEEKAKEAGSRWNVSSFTNIDYLSKTKIIYDTAIICVPEFHHLDIIKKLIHIKNEIGLKTIICEKPFCNSHENSLDAYLSCKANDIDLIVSYPRQFNNCFKLVKSALKNETIHCIIGKYNRGLLRDGCHLINIILFFLLDLENYNNKIDFKINKNNSINKILDYSENDPTEYFNFEIADIADCKNIHIIPIDGRKCSIFELEIYTDKNRYYFKDNSKLLSIQKIVDKHEFGNYKKLDCDENKTEINSNLQNNLLTSVLDSIMFKNKSEISKISQETSILAILTHAIIKKRECGGELSFFLKKEA